VVARHQAHRAGALALAVLADSLDARILIALDTGSTGIGDLRTAVGVPPPTTLRGHLRALEKLGLLARRRAEVFPGRTEVGLLESGRGLLRVAERVAGWLAARPGASVALGTPTSHAVLVALADGWSSLLVRALAAAPLSLVQLDRLIGSLDYPTLSRRVDALKVTGLVRACGSTDRATPYAPTDWLARAVGPLISAACWELESGVKAAPIGAVEVEAALLLGGPRIRAAASVSGSCRLVVRMGDRGAAGGVVRVDRGRVVSVTIDLRQFASAAISAGTATWMSALLDGDGRGLAVSGNQRLALPLAESMTAALEGPRRR